MIQITENIKINEDDIREEFIRSSGPGGQNVNKVATAVQLRFDVRHSPSLPEEVKERLIKLAGNRITEDGELIITAKRFRTQGKNREDALRRLIDLIQKAAQKPKVRRRRKISLISKYRRLEEKRKISEKKRQRRFSQREVD